MSQDDDVDGSRPGDAASREAKMALADLMIRKAGLIRTIRHEMHKQGVVYYNGLTEILDAIEKTKKGG